MTKHDGRKHGANKHEANKREPTKPETAKTEKGEAKPLELSGVVVDVFGRRFTLEADARRTLVDLGKLGAGLVIVEPGARLRVTGERRKGEVKAQTVAREGGLGFVLRKDKAPKLAEGAKAAASGAVSKAEARPEAKAAPNKPAVKTAPADKPDAKTALAGKPDAKTPPPKTVGTV